MYICWGINICVHIALQSVERKEGIENERTGKEIHRG